MYLMLPIFMTKLLTRLRLGFSNLREHKFRHDFQVTINLPV